MSQTIDVKKILSNLKLLIVLVVMGLVLTIVDENFLTPDNIKNILQQISINVCLSIGMTLVILTGGIDLSVGSILGFSGIVMAGLIKNGIEIPYTDSVLEFAFSGAVIVGLLTGLVLGLFNGLVITRFKIPPFIATLGMLSMARGWTMLWTGGEPITGLSEGFRIVGAESFLGVPIIIWIPVFLIVAFVVVLRKSRFGRHLYAIGGNEKAAELSGLRVNRIKVGAYALCGLLCAVAGLIMTAKLDSATVIAGGSYELEAIAAVVIGGTSLSGGRGTMMGTFLGCLIIGVLANGLNLLGVPEAWQLVVKGGVILLAAAIDNMHSRK